MQKLLYGIDLGNFYKAFSQFEKFRQNLNSEQEKAGAVQAFEFSYEMAWKTMKRILSAKGVDARSPRDVFREAASINMISDPETWFKFIEVRNISAHTYNEQVLDQVIDFFPTFSEAIVEFKKYIENEIARA